MRSGAVWAQQAKLLPSDGAVEDSFGISVALLGDTALVGAWGDSDQGIYSGSAYVFVRSGAVWAQQAKLLPSDGAASDLFGGSVALSGDTALVGGATQRRPGVILRLGVCVRAERRNLDAAEQAPAQRRGGERLLRP
ncbi:FG-GAP repeat protein [Polyangium jinanense]|uniref:FG-GAP repeat protein n=1 Tax=Polyangium jinanense TaxID=2829994 RepID=A0A9X4AVP2_9BACT|nr:FG-GAP repeat protein [Polyangium jinanense]MDC3984485.1 FG-GAP repeat protein [Polyangium jinanense]